MIIYNNKNEQLNEGQIKKLKNIRVFVCVSAVGKSYLAKKYPKQFVDHDRMRDYYQLGLSEDATEEEFAIKQSEAGIEPREDIVGYSDKTLIDCYNDGKRIILTSPVPYVTECLQKHKLPYVSVVYDPENPFHVEEYRNRRIARGNDEKWCDWLESALLQFREHLLNDPGATATIKFESATEYLSDAMQEIGVLKENKKLKALKPSENIIDKRISQNSKQSL